MSSVLSSPFFGIALCIFTYKIAVWFREKTNLQVFNPLLISIIVIIAVLKVFGIPFDSFYKGGEIINMFLAPATAVLAVPVYRQFETLKKNLLPIIIGCGVGSATALFSVFWLCKLFKLDEVLTLSLLPKSVTAPIAMELSKQYGGLVPVTVAVVVITGIFGAVVAPVLIKLFKVKNKIAVGIAIGTSSHAMGTTKAISMGEVEGAMSGIAIGIAGLFTVIFMMFF